MGPPVLVKQPRRPGASALLAVLVPVLLVTACAALDPGLPDAEEDLRHARERWEALGPASYRMVYVRTCFCVPTVVQPVEITVRAGVVESRRYVASGDHVPPNLQELFLSVEELFDEADAAFRQGAAEVRAEYDPALGYPVDLYIDGSRQVADDEVGHRVRELTALP